MEMQDLKLTITLTSRKKKVALKHKRKGSMMQIGYALDPQMSFSDT